MSPAQYLTLILAAAIAADEVTDADWRAFAASLLSIPREHRTLTQRESIALIIRGMMRPGEVTPPSIVLESTGWGNAGVAECRDEVNERIRAWRVSRG